MTKQVLKLLAIVLAPVCAFAIDGVTLINQSTVMAAGGFPYKITEAGSYQLSGNLQVTPGKQAILVAASNVVLDLNGFNVSCSLGISTGNPFSNCVGDSGATVSGISDVTIRNGSVTLTQTAGAPNFGGTENIARGFLGSSNLIIEGVHAEAINFSSGFSPAVLQFGPNSIIRHNIISGSGSTSGVTVACPSFIEGNVNSTGGFGSANGGVCVLVNNIGPF